MTVVASPRWTGIGGDDLARADRIVEQPTGHRQHGASLPTRQSASSPACLRTTLALGDPRNSISALATAGSLRIGSSTPESLACDCRAVTHRLELGPDHVLGHLGVADNGAETAI